MNRTQRVLAFSALTFTALCWSFAPIFIRVLSTAYDPHTQAFVRYASASITLIVICLFRHREEFLRLLHSTKGLRFLAALMVLQQFAWTHGCYGSTAIMATLLTKLTVVFVIIFSFFLFHEERVVISSPIFLAGTLLSLIGVAGVLAKNPASLRPTFDIPALLLLLTALCWAIYTVWAKHLVLNAHPVPMFTVLASLATLGLAVLALLLGEPKTIVTAGPQTTTVAFISGVLPIALAHPSFHYAQKRLGAAFSSSFMLLTPLLTYASSLLIWPDEQLLPNQWIGAGVLLTGAFLVILAGRLARAPEQPFARY